MHFGICMPFMSYDKEIALDIEDLLNYTNWTAISKQFLKKSGDYIVLKTICEEYFMIIENFYNWLYSEFLKYHSHDFIETKKLISVTNNSYLEKLYNSLIHNQNINLRE